MNSVLVCCLLAVVLGQIGLIRCQPEYCYTSKSDATESCYAGQFYCLSYDDGEPIGCSSLCYSGYSCCETTGCNKYSKVSAAVGFFIFIIIPVLIIVCIITMVCCILYFIGRRNKRRLQASGQPVGAWYSHIRTRNMIVPSNQTYPAQVITYSGGQVTHINPNQPFNNPNQRFKNPNQPFNNVNQQFNNPNQPIQLQPGRPQFGTAYMGWFNGAPINNQPGAQVGNPNGGPANNQPGAQFGNPQFNNQPSGPFGYQPQGGPVNNQPGAPFGNPQFNNQPGAPFSYQPNNAPPPPYSYNNPGIGQPTQPIVKY